MFSKKKEELFCYECGCVLYYVSKRVKVDFGASRSFCKKCTPLYDLVRYTTGLLIDSDGWKTKERYYKYQPDIEVTEQGEPIKK